jgi:hypothetical protein
VISLVRSGAGWVAVGGATPTKIAKVLYCSATVTYCSIREHPLRTISSFALSLVHITILF